MLNPTEKSLVAFIAQDDYYPASVHTAEVCHNCSADNVAGEIADYLEQVFEKPFGFHYTAEDGALKTFDFEGHPCPEHYNIGDMVLVYNPYEELSDVHCGVVVGAAAVPEGYRVLDEFGGVHSVSVDMMFRPDCELSRATKDRLHWLTTHDRLPRRIYKVLIVELKDGHLFTTDFASFTALYAAETQVQLLNDFDLHYAVAVVIMSQPINEMCGPRNQKVEQYYTVEGERTNIRVIAEFADYDGFDDVIHTLDIDPVFFRTK